MLQMKWIDRLPSGKLEGGVALLNQLKWNITAEQDGSDWVVFAGHKVLLKTSIHEAVDTFLYGMALAYSVLPEPILKEFQRFAEAATE